MSKVRICTFVLICLVLSTVINAQQAPTKINVDINTIPKDGNLKPLPSDVPVASAAPTQIPQTDSTPPLTYPPPIQRNGTFVRLITDIFQIPIGVLQSVTRLLTNPFITEKKAPST